MYMLTNKDIEKLKGVFVTRDEMFTRLDEVMGELKAIREEIGAMFYRQREHSDQLDNHENRLSNLEKHRSNTSNH